MNEVHVLADRFKKYLTNRNDWVNKRDLIAVANKHGYSKEDAINGLNLMDDNPYPYEYCEVARRLNDGATQFRVWPMTPYQIEKKKEQFEWFDMLPEVEPIKPIIIEDDKPVFGKPYVKTSKRRNLSAK